jgi:hypothetical protein
MRHDNLVTAHWTGALSQADAIKQLLRAAGVPCVLGGVLRARRPGVPMLDIQIQVPVRFLAHARQLIEGGFPCAAAD